MKTDTLWLANAPVEDMTAEEIEEITGRMDTYEDPYLATPIIDDDDATTLQLDDVDYDSNFADPVIAAASVVEPSLATAVAGGLN